MGRNKSGTDTMLRQWHMLRGIPRYPHKVTVANLGRLLEAAGFVVTTRTLQRDLVELSDEFPLLADDRERPYGWSWHKDAPAFDLPNLSNEGALAFAMIERYLRPLLPHAMLSQLQPYFALASKRLTGVGPKRGSHGWLGKVAVVQPNQTLIPPRIDPAVNAAVTDALLRDRQVRIGYSRRGETKLQDYVLNPLGLVQRGPVLYVVGTLFQYDDVRLFALHRVRQAAMLDVPVRRPKNFELEAYLASGALDFGAGKRLRLEVIFDASTAEHLYETPLAPDQRLDIVDAEHVRLRATVADTPQLRWWILAFGEQIEVKAPASLRASLAATAQAMAQRYPQAGA